jgi:hypothetical protein
MNQSFYESRSREKISDLRKEGMLSQAHYRSGATKTKILSRLAKLILIILGFLAMIQVIMW